MIIPRFTRRDRLLFLSGFLAGGLVVALGFGLWLQRSTLQRVSRQFLPQRYAAHTCQEAAPGMVEGPQVWLTNPRPPLDGTTVLCARLVVNGKLMRDAALRGVIRYSTRSGSMEEAGMGTTLAGVDGIIQMGFGISDPRPDYPVELDVRLRESDLAPFAYEAHIEYTPSTDPMTYPPP